MTCNTPVYPSSATIEASIFVLCMVKASPYLYENELSAFTVHSERFFVAVMASKAWSWKMATLRIDIEGNPKSIPYRSFLDVANNTLAILGDLDHRFSHRQQGAVEWYMNDLRQNGSLRLEIYSKIVQLKRKQLPDVAKQVAGSFVKGFEMLETQGRSPEYLTSYGMDRAKQMTNVIGHEGAHTIRASSPETEETIEITKKAVQNLELLLPEASKSIGSVEGML